MIEDSHLLAFFVYRHKVIHALARVIYIAEIERNKPTLIVQMLQDIVIRRPGLI